MHRNAFPKQKAQEWQNKTEARKCHRCPQVSPDNFQRSTFQVPVYLWGCGTLVLKCPFPRCDEGKKSNQVAVRGAGKDLLADFWGCWNQSARGASDVWILTQSPTAGQRRLPVLSEQSRPVGSDSYREGTGANAMSAEEKQPGNLNRLRLLTKMTLGMEQGAIA